MKLKYFLLCLGLTAFFFGQAAPAPALSTTASLEMLDGPGGKDKKTKKLAKPHKHARQSVKDARRARKMKAAQISSRAKTRNFFHRMFNTKFGKPVNFRSRRQRNRWKKGR